MVRPLSLAVVLLVLTACPQGSVTIGGSGGSGGGETGTGGGAMGTGGGNASTGGGTGTGGTGGSGGTGGVGGSGGGVVPPYDGGDFNPDDAGVIAYDGGCGPIDAGNPPLPRKCGPPQASECNGQLDSYLTSRGVQASLLNGATGNGYDDDCDGEVDEGCSCNGNGQTRECYLVPATQADQTTKKPVGWCVPNAVGSLDCAGGELATWSGVCRGASRPSVHDTCATGDFNCDGLSGNNDIAGCKCGPTVSCPTQELTFAPFPATNAIPAIDGALWVDAAQRSATTNWTWTLVGGDCDNVLPFPTFALFNGPDSKAANARKGVRTPVKFDGALSKYVATAGQPLISVQAAAYGSGLAGGKVHPAFALSGDYTLQGEFDLAGTHYVCTQKIRVRAPGVRAELCWDTVGGDGTSTGNDIDLHFARLQGTSCPNKGWDEICDVNTTGRYQDCYYWDGSGCPASAPTGPGWGYANSAASACQGWGSKRGTSACTNPRLDRDNVSCDRSESDPNATVKEFCGPENINLDNPKDNDRFVIGVNHYDNTSGTARAKPHVNIYCNGARVLSLGYNPATGQTAFPVLTRAGQDDLGDFWTAAIVTTHVDGGVLTDCEVATVPSHHADPTRDGVVPDAGGNGICVDSVANATPAPYKYNYASHRFVDPGSAQVGLTAGSQPTLPKDFCKH